MFWNRRPDPLVAAQREEIIYLRAQIEAGRVREDDLRKEVIILASSRAAAEIAFYEGARKAPAEPRPWPPQERTPPGPSAYDNHLQGGEHFEPDPQPGPRPGDVVDDELLADATIERAVKEREASRLATVAD